MTKEEIEKHLRDLVNEKRDLDYKVNVANEYSKTVKYMLENEKNKVLKIQDEINQIQEKVNNCIRYHNLIHDNLNKTQLKNDNYSELNNKLQNDIDLAEKIINDNNSKNENLNNNIFLREEKVEDLKQKIKELKYQNEIEFKRYKENIYEKIKKSQEDKEEIKKKEKEYIDIIFCLYILQKYFLEQDNFDDSKLLSSREYKTFINKNYEIFSNSNNRKEINNELSESENGIIKNNIDDNIITDINSYDINKTPNRTLYKEKTSRKVLLLHLEEIEQKYKEINLTKENIFDYISKLSSKISFNKYFLSNFHNKEFLLREKKDKFYQRVKNIINNDYLKFEGITKNNSRFNSFLKKNKSFIEEIKNQNRINNLNEMKKELNKNEIDKKRKITIHSLSSGHLNKNIKKYISNKEQIIINSNDLYKKCNQLMMAHNNFLDNIADIFNDIVISLQNMNLNIKSEDDSSKIDMSENEYIKSIINEKDKIIDYQNLNNQIIPNNAKTLVNYIKNLIEYNNKNIKEKLEEKELYNNLLLLFYKDNQINDKKNEEDNLDEFFFEHFISKNVLNQNIFYNHFYLLWNETSDFIKSITNFLREKDDSSDNFINNNLHYYSTHRNNRKLSKISNNYDISSKSSFFQKSVSATSPASKKIIFRKSYASSERNDLNNIRDKSTALIEDNENSSESEIIPKEEKLFKRKINYFEQNVMNHLYKPSFEKSDYLRKLNSNMKIIKNMTFNHSKFNFIMGKKRNDIDLMGKQMLLYNNPKLHADELSKILYNDINNIILNSRRKNEMNFKEKRMFRSISTKNKNKNKI